MEWKIWEWMGNLMTILPLCCSGLIQPIFGHCISYCHNLFLLTSSTMPVIFCSLCLNMQRIKVHIWGHIEGIWNHAVKCSSLLTRLSCFSPYVGSQVHSSQMVYPAGSNSLGSVFPTVHLSPEPVWSAYK